MTSKEYEHEMSPISEASTMDKIPSSPRRSKGKNVALVSALCLALFLAALDTVLITTALPTISAQFNVTDAGYAWVGSAYLLTNAASVPFWGKISDIFGRKPILLLANAIFLAGSLISALSKNLEMLIAGRAVQGLGGGGIVILVNICVGDLFSLRYRLVFANPFSKVLTWNVVNARFISVLSAQYGQWLQHSDRFWEAHLPRNWVGGGVFGLIVSRVT
jgi:MFS family permease